MAEYPIGRMAFQVAFLSTLGTIYGFSSWCDKFKQGPFPTWDLWETGIVYSFGSLGAFATPVGGYLYGRFGPKLTYLSGLCCLMLGVLGLLICCTPAILGLPTSLAPLIVGFFYYLEEQGASTLYMAIACDTLLHFPASNTSLSMGFVALGFSVSAIIAGVIVGAVSMSINVFFASIAGLATTFVLLRVYVLGDIGESDTSGEGQISYGAVFKNSRFHQFIALSIGLIPCIALLGFTSYAGTYAFGVVGDRLAMASMISNTVGRLVFSAAYDHARFIPAGRVLCAFIIVILLSFSSMAQASLPQKTDDSHAGMIGSAGCVMAVLCFGGCAPITAVYVKDHFPPNLCGVVIGLQNIFLALGVIAFNFAFSPNTTVQGGFFRTFIVSALTCCFAIIGFTIFEHVDHHDNSAEKILARQRKD